MKAIIPKHSEHATWLCRLYLVRAAFSFVWVALAWTVARTSPVSAAVLLVAYPAWDALANWMDIRMAGGPSANPTQVANAWISGLVTLAVVLALATGMPVVLRIFGLWAIVSGLLQLGTAIRRRKSDQGQWVMMLSGAQSALAGGFFVMQRDTTMPVAGTIAGYAMVGAAYFLISGLVVLVRQRRSAVRSP